MTINDILLRSIRKTAHITNRLTSKSAYFSYRVEAKATRLITGTDLSAKYSSKNVVLDKVYFNHLPSIKPVMPAMPAVGAKPSVTLFVPTLQGSSFFGGNATALIVAAKFAQKTKRQLRVVQTVKTGIKNDLTTFFANEGINAKNLDIKVISVADRQYNQYGYIPMFPDDIFIASAWWDAHLINQLPIKKFVYLVQDYEPAFYNNSDEYVLAEETYRSHKIIPLCNTKLMLDYMHSRGYSNFAKDAFFFEPAVSRIKSGKLIDKQPGAKKKIFLYGRPAVSRNLFFSALQALKIAIEDNDISTNDYDFFMAGQDDLPNIALTGNAVIKNLGKMNMGDYVDFSKTVDIAISPMLAPHPNYPTLEFASTGTAVVTTKYANKQSLDNYSKNIFMSDPDATSMAQAIKRAAQKPYADKIETLGENSILTNWDDSLDASIDKITQLL